MLKWLTRLMDSNEKELRRLRPTVEEINALEAEFQALSDDELRAKTDDFKERLAEGESLDDLLPEAFAAVREASRRTIGLRHFDVQLLGGMVLHEGKIAEMKTGEGKTLVASLPVYLNALTGQGVHVVTVNDYLAKRDPQWMGPIYHLLGITVGCIQHEAAFQYDPTYESSDPRLQHLAPVSRHDAYRTDVTYGTNNEFGFDYLRDNMVVDLAQCVQREQNYAIVDEVDNILIDEARTPLIISAPAEDSTEHYYRFARLVPMLQAGVDYKVDERVRAVTLTEAGIGKMEKLLHLPNLYDPENYNLTHYMENALKAHVLYRRDREYVVKDGEIIIVDEFTGRLMPGRRWSEGLHQAVEAKEGAKIQRQSVTWATITFQNYFRMYRKLAGMTGTAATEAEEFHKIYKLDVVAVPTHRPMIRADHPDQVYKGEDSKFRAVAKEVEEMNRAGRPVLIGTTSIEKSERLSDLLMRRGVAHEVLNAKYHEKEAAIIAQAGKLGAVTVATNMAGRGVDIILGGNPPDPEQTEKIRELGGLHIVGTERHEARRIDNQLRGRAGRQGDPGSSRFYLSLEDEIMRRFGGDRIKGFMEWAGLDEDVPIEHGLISKSIENAQTKVEGFNFDIRKHTVEYDDVMNKQREVIYAERKKILSGADLKSNVQEMVEQAVAGSVAAHLTDEHGGNWDLDGLETSLQAIMPLSDELTPDDLAHMSRTEVEEALQQWAVEVYQQREQEFGSDNMRMLERLVMLRIIDNLWVEHLTAMEDLREGIGLRAYGQTDPLVAYKKEAHVMFSALMERIQHDIVHTIYHVGILKEASPRPALPAAALRTNRDGEDGASTGNGRGARQAEPVRAGRKVGRNDPCPCGSGKKYKKCHGRGG